jgi:hypothetical protein
MSSIKQLGGIMGLASFFFTIFAILGVSLWDGKIHYRCYWTELPDPNGKWAVNEDNMDLCSDINPCKPVKMSDGSMKPTYCGSRFEVNAQGIKVEGPLN